MVVTKLLINLPYFLPFWKMFLEETPFMLKKKKGKLMFWVIDPKIIEILNSNFSNFKKHMLMWKIIRSLCTLCWMGFLYPIYPSLSSKSVSTFEKLRKEKEKKLSPTQHDTRTEKQTKQKRSICFISHGHRTLKLNPNLPCFPLILENQNTLTFFIFLSSTKTENP